MNHLRDTLIELDCTGSCGITQKGINGLRKLEKLDASDNKKITDVRKK